MGYLSFYLLSSFLPLLMSFSFSSSLFILYCLFFQCLLLNGHFRPRNDPCVFPPSTTRRETSTDGSRSSRSPPPPLSPQLVSSTGGGRESLHPYLSRVGGPGSCERTSSFSQSNFLKIWSKKGPSPRFSPDTVEGL